MTIGGHNHAVVALDPKDGLLVWQKQDFENSPSSPVLIQFDGQDQMVAFFNEAGDRGATGFLAGLDPNNGELLWRHPHKTDWGLNIALPVWGDGNILFISSAYSGGSRALQLRKTGPKTTVEELWHNRRMRVHHSSILRIGDVVYGSSGDFGPAPLTAVEVRSGQVLWQDRTFSKANFVYADGKLIVIDEDGTLALATVSPQGLKVLSRVSLFTKNAWTAPSLAGTTLYARDRRTILALDLR